MTHGSDNKNITRRAALGVAAAAMATPALADECHVGPPPHTKGPLVFMDMDQVELDAAYDQASYAPLRLDILARMASASEAVRNRLGAPLRRAYGPSPVEQLDIYQTTRAHAPIFIFIHGGAWRGEKAKDYGYPAEMFANAGAHYIALDFAVITDVGGDLRVMADQVRRGIAWVYRNAGTFGGDRNRLYVGGHSSGGHLCGVALTTDWQKEFNLPPNFVTGALCISGLYDMKPVRLSKRSAYVKFTDAMVEKLSAMRHLESLHTPLIIAHGSCETPEFQRQTRDFAAAVIALGKPVELILGEGYNHFELLETLANPYGLLGRAMLRQMGLRGDLD
jgi:arylformamidase